eukprot:TRINITY_DN27129_c0_g1_i1.p2 TRINITY_DN27129_c0_g1~~TRINITY_DN27129_c0_g1_i1.p2  ORF type:complete len:249 (-),score=77.87 TRINITY_DN27129_c0_g1_i1:173-838(-)
MAGDDAMETGAAGLGIKRTISAEQPKPQQKASRTAGKEKKGNGEDDLKQLVVQVAKLSLVSARQVATLSSVLIEVILVPKDKATDITNGIKGITKTYHEETKQLSPAEKGSFGSPHLFIWQELIAIAGRKAQEVGDLEMAAYVKTYSTNLDSKTKEKLKETPSKDASEIKREITQTEVKVCRYTKCWNPDMMKLEVSTASSTNSRDMQICLFNFLKKHMGA